MEITVQFPEAGPVYQQAEPHLVRCLTLDSYRLHYRVWLDKKRIEVLAVRHCARALPVF